MEFILPATCVGASVLGVVLGAIYWIEGRL